MPRLLNTRTNTIHYPRADQEESADCGSLSGVPPSSIRVIENGAEEGNEVSKCGNCFEQGGGY